jgi:hypothetical protein
MKRILIALLLVGCSVPSLLAQRKGFAMGFKGGVNLS